MDNIYLIQLFEALSFSAKKHKKQKRKDLDNTPYINHPVDVARNIAFLTSLDEKEKLDILNAAILHDTVEDTPTTLNEIENLFNENVAKLVEEVTNQKELTSEQSKLFELEKAKKLSLGAALIRISDKIENVKDINKTQPINWNLERKLKYCNWARNLVQNISIQHDSINQLKYLFYQRYYETLNKLFENEK